MEFKIRKINKSDFEFVYSSVCVLEDEIFDRNNFSKVYLENILNTNYLYLIAESNSNNLGFISLHTQNLLHHCGCVGEIEEFYIMPAYRDKGIGRALLEKVMEFASLNNFKSLEVTSNKNRVANALIYEKFGLILTHNKFTKIF